MRYTSSVMFVCLSVSCSSSSSVDQLDAGRRALCPIHCAKQFQITKQNQNELINC